MRVGGNAILGNGDTGRRCAVPLSGGYLFPHTGQALTVDKRTLQIILWKMQGYSTKEIAPLVGLTPKTIYKRLDRLRKKLKDFKE